MKSPALNRAETAAATGEDRQAAGPGQQVDGDGGGGPAAAQQQRRDQDEEILQDDRDRADRDDDVAADGDQRRQQRGEDQAVQVRRLRVHGIPYQWMMLW